MSRELWEPQIWPNDPPDDFCFLAPLGGDASGSPAVQQHGGQAARAQGRNRNLVAQATATDNTAIQRSPNGANHLAEAMDPWNLPSRITTPSSRAGATARS